jgi:2-alkenal reductase
VRDEATGIAFVKTSAERLNVASFGDDAVLQPADPVFLADAASVKTASVLAARRLAVVTRNDYLESTERLGRRLIIDQSGLPGAPAVNANGEVIGIAGGDGTIVPASFVVSVLRDLFKDGKITRPQAGARFISLDGLPNAQAAGYPSTGALLTGGGKYPAVTKGSAAEAAGLREGDVIVAVERDRINGDETLSERLQDYAPGAKVSLTVLRAGKELKVTMTLK